jgi:NAD(P)-dependent dehydrogenase (short-subunit alcohol dehydrogenase family)
MVDTSVCHLGAIDDRFGYPPNRLKLQQRAFSMDLFDLSGRVCVVTGGNGGIGLGIAKALGSAGSAVCIWGRNPEKNARATEIVGETGSPCTSIACDVGAPESVEAAMRQTLDRFGRVDGCFANAGIGGGGRQPFIERSETDFQNMMDVNAGGVFRAFRSVARHMVERAQNGDAFGRLVATSSLASLFGTARNEHYAASKSAINSMVKALAVELARYGVTANAVLPGWIETEMTERLIENERFVTNVLPRVPLRRFGTPADFGGIAIYLMSKASGYHTGDCILIDGGYAAF